MSPRRQSRRMSHAPRLSIINMAGDQQEEHRKYHIKDCLCNHVKSIVTLVMILAMVFCIVMIVLVHKWRWEKQEAGCIDVAIIGAGVSGSYAAWRLRHHNLRINVYEASEHVGGKLLTELLEGNPDIRLEMGATEYDPTLHLLLNRTIHALKLLPLPSPPQSQDPPIYYLRDRMIRKPTDPDSTLYNLQNHERGKNPRDLAKYYMLRALSNSSYWVHQPLTAYTRDNEPLYQQGLWNLFGTVASQEGLSLLLDTLPWRGFLSNENAAALGSLLWAPVKGLQTLADGMQTLPQGLMDGFLNASDQHQLHLSRRLACIKSPNSPSILNMTFIHTIPGIHGRAPRDIRRHEHVCAREVILAIPQKGLKALDWKPLEDSLTLQENLHSVVENPVVVAYFTYNQTWWRGTNPYPEVITDLPVRKVSYRGSHRDDNGTAEYVFQVTSSDGKDVEYFNGLLDRTFYDGSKIFSCTKPSHFIHQVHAQMAEMYGVWDQTIREPHRVIIKRWEGPIAGGWSVWRRGVHWSTITHRMLRPSVDHSVYIAGNAFMGAKDQFTIEGAMQSVENMLNLRYTHLP